METAPLKGFATWARTSLIREVTARITAVLAPGSTERVEMPGAVAALENAVHAAGGGDKGRASVADTVAYTWFNRIIALRFMDANGYTGIGVVSPQTGVDLGQPEILAEAKRGVIDTEVASQKTRTTVASLLDRSRVSADPQGEAYALLLADYCRHWNKAMPFMFEREGDFTELLIPANLLSDDSVLNRAVKVLTEDVCQDVEVIGWLYQFYISEKKDEVFAGFKSNKKAGAEEIPAATQLFTPHWIVRYLVENSLGRLWMLNRPHSRLVDRMEYYIAPVGDETDFLTITSPEEIKVLDPACGSGHMLTYAFDLLCAIYEEEGYAPSDIPENILTNNLYGAEIDRRAGALAGFALAMKARAKQRTFLSRQIEPNICVIEPISFSSEELANLVTKTGDRQDELAYWNLFADADVLGSLISPNAGLTTSLATHLDRVESGADLLTVEILERARQVVRQARFLGGSYSVVMANPPYMGSKNMSPRLAEFASDAYKNSKSDLYAMFIERCESLTAPGGVTAMITMQSWMFIGSYRRFRERLLQENWIQSLVHLGTGAFETISGEVVSTVAWCMTNTPPTLPSTFVSLVGFVGQEKPVEMRRLLVEGHSDFLYRIEQLQLAALPGSPVAFWLGERVLQAFQTRPPLGSKFDIKVGMQTSNNAKFVRYWWEVSASEIATGDLDSPKWIWYAKGGPFRRWTGNLDSVLHYNRDPSYILGQTNATILPLDALKTPKVTWTHMSPGRVSFRILPENTFHDIGSHAIYVDEHDALPLVAYLNSEFVGDLIQGLNPTVNIQTSDVARIPLFDIDNNSLAALADRAVTIAKGDAVTQETHPEYWRNQLVGTGFRLSTLVSNAQANWREKGKEIRGTEAEIESLVASATGVTSTTEPRLTSLENDAFVEESTWARVQIGDLVSYSVGCMFGRYSLDEPGLILADQGATLAAYLMRVPSPSFMPDADNVMPIVDGDWFEDDIVERFRQFLRTAFGEEHFEENLRFATESLGAKSLRDYFVRSFYKDHVQRYKKRPIYWLFSSPNGSFNALIYMHRYTPSTVSTVLNEYLREFQAKLKASLEHAEGSNNAKEADRLRKILLELDGYEHDVLYPLASQNIAIDLDDGVKVNYPKFGAALKKIVGLEASE